MKFMGSFAALALVLALAVASPLDDAAALAGLGLGSPQANAEGSLQVNIRDNTESNPQECHDPSTLDNRDLVLIDLSRKLDTIAESLTEEEKDLLDDLLTSDGCTDEEVEHAIEAHVAGSDARVKRQTVPCSVTCNGRYYSIGSCTGGKHCKCKCGWWNRNPSCKCVW